jgi:hypothetical protein
MPMPVLVPVLVFVLTIGHKFLHRFDYLRACGPTRAGSEQPLKTEDAVTPWFASAVGA